MRKLFLIFLLSGILLFPVSILAKTTASDCSQYCTDLTTYDPPVNQVCICNPLSAASFEDLIAKIIYFLFVIAITLTPLMVLIGAFYIMTAAGDVNKVTTGKNIILYTLIGFAIILLAKGIVSVIEQILEV